MKKRHANNTDTKYPESPDKVSRMGNIQNLEKIPAKIGRDFGGENRWRKPLKILVEKTLMEKIC